jgi:hypothetical protein
MKHEHMKHKNHEGMMDNRMVNDTHQEGISRVLQRGHDKMDYEGHFGKMGVSHGKSGYCRAGDSMTPKKA